MVLMSRFRETIAMLVALMFWVLLPSVANSSDDLRADLDRRLTNYAVCLVAHHELGNKKLAKTYFDIGHEITSIAEVNDINVSHFDDLASHASKLYPKMSRQFLTMYVKKACHKK